MEIRKSNYELLRICAALFVIFLHINNPVYTNLGDFALMTTGSGKILLFLQYIAVPAVDIFVMLTGYFSVFDNKIKTNKIVYLIVYLSVIRVIQYLIGSLVQSVYVFSIRGLVGSALPINYYVVLFCVLLALTPMMNDVIKRKKNDRCFLLFIFIIFSIIPSVVDGMAEILNDDSILNLSTISAFGSQHGYNLINFIFVYTIGAYIRMSDYAKTISIKKLLLFSLFCILMGFFLNGIIPRTSMSYCNPFVVATSMFMILIFEKWDLKSAFINKLSKGTYLAFLFQSTFLYYFDIEPFIEKGEGFGLLYVFVYIIITYLLCLLIHFLLEPIIKLFSNSIITFVKRNVKIEECN